MTVMNSRMKELQAAYDDFMRGNDGKSLEGILKTVVEDNKRVKIQCKRDIDEIISTLKGIDCGGRGTSCPDQLALALLAYKQQQA